VEHVDAPPPPHFTDAQEEEQLWEELRDHGTSLNRVLNEALRIHGGPTWRVFQVRRYSRVVPLACCFLLCSVVLAFIFAVRRSWILSAGGRSWSSAPATGTVPSTR
jgi:hypothetical protein